MNTELDFGLSEDTMRHIDEVRATLSIMASMGVTGSSDRCTDISKADLISVLWQAEEKLKTALSEIIKLPR